MKIGDDSMCEVITIGEPMVLFVADSFGKLEDIEHFTKFLAGAEVNVCIGLTRLGHKVSYITKLGQDPLGKYIHKFLLKENIDVSYLKYDDKFPTGFQLKEKIKEGDPEVVSFRKGSAATHVTKEDIEKINLTGIKHIHLTGIFPALSQSTREAVYFLIKRAKDIGIRISFDPNLRPKLWPSKDEMVKVINDLASLCDIVLPGVNEGVILMGSDDPEKIADFYINNGAKIVIVKVGAKGAFVKTSEKAYIVPGFKVENVVDTVGAGDGFAVGVISGLLEGKTLEESVLRGNAIGSLQVMTPGDNDGLPTPEKLDEYIKFNKRC